MFENVSLPRVAFWLVPRLQDRILLGRQIASFAEKYSSPLFLPHVTLYSCHRSAGRQELNLLAALAKKCSPFFMSVDSVGSSERLSQAFFLRLQRNNEADGLSRSFAKETVSASSFTFDPHLSLVYQDLSAAERSKLANNWSSPMKDVCFDQLWAVAIPAQIRTLEDFYGWQTLLTCQLDSSSNVDTL